MDKSPSVIAFIKLVGAFFSIDTHNWTNKLNEANERFWKGKKLTIIYKLSGEQINSQDQASADDTTQALDSDESFIQSDKDPEQNVKK